jgi:uncharacterized cupin superfamily protein
MSQRILNIADVELQPRPPQFAAAGPAAEVFDARMGQVSTRLGAQKLGYNLTAVPPGKRAFPFHNHRVNEEMFFVLQGAGELRIGGERHPIRQGDVIACPPGGPELAHQIINTGSEELRYLAVSTKQYPEICDYPDSGKFGLLAEYPPGPDGKPNGFRFVGKPEQQVGYWEGEGSEE